VCLAVVDAVRGTEKVRDVGDVVVRNSALGEGDEVRDGDMGGGTADGSSGSAIGVGGGGEIGRVAALVPTVAPSGAR